MPNYVHRTNKQYLTSVSPASLPESEANYIQDPDMSAVVGEPSKYWTITGDVVSLKSAGEQAAVDVALDAQKTQQDRDTVIATPENTDALGVEIRALIQLMNKRDNYLTTRIIELQDRVQAMCDSAGSVANMKGDGLAVSISPTNTRARANAVQDYKDDTAAGVND